MENVTLEEYKKKILEYDKKFAYNEYNGRRIEGEPSYAYIRGTIPVIVSAPHSVKQIRNGIEKGWDGYVGALSELLHHLTGCHTIYKTYNDGTDANYDKEDHGYKKKVLEVVNQNQIQLLLDLHACASEREFDIDIADDFQKTLNGNKQAEEDLIRTLTEFGVKGICKNCVFTASNPNTVTKYISLNTQITCIEIEIRWEIPINQTYGRFLKIY